MEKEPLSELESVMTLEELQTAKQEANKVFVHKCVREYMVEIIAATRNGDDIVMGVSPRGSLAFLRCVKAYAYLQGRGFVTPDDVKAVAVHVLAHRIVLNYGKGNDSRAFVEQILASVPVPTEDFEA